MVRNCRLPRRFRTPRAASRAGKPLYVPTGQSIQTSEPVAPSADENWPVRHAMQSVGIGPAADEDVEYFEIQAESIGRAL